MMIKMKLLKTTLFFVSILLLVSCSKEEEDTELLIGTWKAMYRIDSGEHFASDECQQQGRLIFSKDGTFYTTYYDKNNVNECVQTGTAEGTWKKISFELYEGGDQNGTNTIRITFPAIDLMRIYEAETDYTEYERVK